MQEQVLDSEPDWLIMNTTNIPTFAVITVEM